MIILRPVALCLDEPALRQAIPEELVALAAREQPWTSYVAWQERTAVGACAFKGGPDSLRQVEIAYLTFPGHTNKGVATQMACLLVTMARESLQVDRVIAHTLREMSPSIRVCCKAGFLRDSDVDDPEDGPVRRWVQIV